MIIGTRISGKLDVLAQVEVVNRFHQTDATDETGRPHFPGQRSLKCSISDSMMQLRLPLTNFSGNALLCRERKRARISLFFRTGNFEDLLAYFHFVSRHGFPSYGNNYC